MNYWLFNSISLQSSVSLLDLNLQRTELCMSWYLPLSLCSTAGRCQEMRSWRSPESLAVWRYVWSEEVDRGLWLWRVHWGHRPPQGCEAGVRIASSCACSVHAWVRPKNEPNLGYRGQQLSPSAPYINDTVMDELFRGWLLCSLLAGCWCWWREVGLWSTECLGQRPLSTGALCPRRVRGYSEPEYK